MQISAAKIQSVSKPFRTLKIKMLPPGIINYNVKYTTR